MPITPNLTPRLNIQDELSSRAMPRMWRDWFDILAMNGVSRLGDQTLGERRGMFPAQQPLAPTFNPAFQSTAEQPRMLGSNPLMASRTGDVGALQALQQSYGQPQASPAEPQVRGQLRRAGARGRGVALQRLQGQRGGLNSGGY